MCWDWTVAAKRTVLCPLFKPRALSRLAHEEWRRNVLNCAILPDINIEYLWGFVGQVCLVRCGILISRSQPVNKSSLFY